MDHNRNGHVVLAVFQVSVLVSRRKRFMLGGAKITASLSMSEMITPTARKAFHYGI